VPAGQEVECVPIYEYQCEACNHKFEVIQKVSDRPIKKCVLCKGKVHKVLSAPGLLFKGSGWYVTDYANPERRKALEAEKKAVSGDGGSGKAESKAESKEPKKGGSE
jgi:putative FmdB family regulatory protein